MAITSAKATFGLDAVGTGSRTWITQTASLGSSATSMSLTSSTIAFVAQLYLKLSTHTGTVNGDTLATSSTSSAAVAATQTLTLSGNAVASETVTIGDKTYTWRDAVTTTANEVKIGATASDSIDNLIVAVTAGAGSGTVYGSATTVNLTASASAGAGDTMTVTALTAGEAGNAIVTTETMTNGSFAAATLAGGLDATGWTGATVDFEGVAYANPTANQGFLVYCESGSVVMAVGSTVKIPLIAGGKALIANNSGIAQLLADIVFTAAANDTRLYIALMAS